MTKNDVIAIQAVKIEKLKRQIKMDKEAKDKVFYIIYGIGGPLNDNKLGYSKEQMKDFWEIVTALGLR